MWFRNAVVKQFMGKKKARSIEDVQTPRPDALRHRSSLSQSYMIRSTEEQLIVGISRCIASCASI